MVDQAHNTTTTKELPLEIIMSNILPRIPAKVVGRCKSVCKQWLFFLSTQQFARMHLRHITTTSNHKLLFIDDQESCMQAIDCESPDHGLTTINTIPFAASPSDVLILGTLDGLVCLCMRKTCELVIWNPLTHAYKKLPNSKSLGFYKIYRDAIGFYTDSSNDYRILHLKHEVDVMGAYVYSRRLDSWRKIGFLQKSEQINKWGWSSVTFSGECLYFTVHGCFVEHEILIIRFDVNLETFQEIRFPKLVESWYWNLVDLDSHIYLFVGYHSAKEDRSYKWELDMWKLEGGETWMKMVALPSIENFPSRWIPNYILSNGKWLVLWDWLMDFHGIDLETDNYICLNPKRMFDWWERVLYIETLVSPS